VTIDQVGCLVVRVECGLKVDWGCICTSLRSGKCFGSARGFKFVAYPILQPTLDKADLSATPFNVSKGFVIEAIAFRAIPKNS
jgi:hypothetical protein